MLLDGCEILDTWQSLEASKYFRLLLTFKLLCFWCLPLRTAGDILLDVIGVLLAYSQSESDICSLQMTDNIELPAHKVRSR